MAQATLEARLTAARAARVALQRWARRGAGALYVNVALLYAWCAFLHSGVGGVELGCGLAAAYALLVAWGMQPLVPVRGFEAGFRVGTVVAVLHGLLGLAGALEGVHAAYRGAPPLPWSPGAGLRLALVGYGLGWVVPLCYGSSADGLARLTWVTVASITVPALLLLATCALMG